MSLLVLLVSVQGPALASTLVVGWDLEQDDGDFTPGGDLLQWKWGRVLAGPGSGYDGENAWGIGLGGPYLNDAVEYLEIPVPDLSGVAAPSLRFLHWYALGAGDTAAVQVDAGGGWTTADPVYGYPDHVAWSGNSGGWVPVTVSLDGLGSVVRVRLVFSADTSGVGTGWFVDQVGLWDGDVTAPRVAALDQLADTEDLDGPYVVTADVDDDSGVAAVDLHWSVDGAEGSATMANQGGGTYAAAIPGQPPDTVVEYWVVATDGANEARAPVSSTLDFRVYLPAPTGLTGPSGRVVATTAMLSWTAPVSMHPVLGYEIFAGDQSVAASAGTTAEVPLDGVDDTFTVCALYAEGLGDPSEPLTLDAVLPAVVALSPAEAFAGDHLRVELRGEYLLLVDGEVEVDLGAGVSVSGVVVRDVDRLVAELEVHADAEPGPRALTVRSAAGEVSLDDAFTVRAASERPQLVALEPSRVTQGDEGEMVISVLGDVGDEVVVDLGRDIVVQSATREGDLVVVSYAVSPGAALGQRSVVVDDGTRVLTGLSLEVEDWSPPPQRTCSVQGGMLGWLAVAAGTLAARLRWRARI